jgi:flagellar biosynthetic protein FliR
VEHLAAQVMAIVLVTLRVAPAFALGGPFALLRIPVSIRVLLSLALALWLVAGRPEATSDRVAAGYPVAGLAAGELFVGMTIALSLQLAFAAILWAGRVIDIQAGFGLAMIADPTTQAQMPLVGTVFAQAGAAIFFTLGGGHDLLALWAASLDFMPMGHGIYTGNLRALTGLMGSLFMMGISPPWPG